MKKILSLLTCSMLLTGCTTVQAKTTVEYSEHALNDLYETYIQKYFPSGIYGTDYTFELTDPSTGSVPDSVHLNQVYQCHVLDSTGTEAESSEKIISFKDTEAPVITSSETVTVIRGTTRVRGLSASDNYDTGLNLQISGMDSTKCGRYKTVVQATDSSGNRASYPVEILVVDSDTANLSEYDSFSFSDTEDDTVNAIIDDTAPQLDTYVDYYEINEGEDIPDFSLGVWAYDAYDSSDLTVTVQGTYSNAPGVYELTYTATDKAGNTSSDDFVLYVKDSSSSSSTSASSTQAVSLANTISSDSAADNSSIADILKNAALAQLGSNAACTTVVSNSLSAANLDFWHGSYEIISGDMQIGDVIAFYTSSSSYPYHVIMYIGDGQCMNGNYNGVAQITSCTSGRAEWQEIRRYYSGS